MTQEGAGRYYFVDGEKVLRTVDGVLDGVFKGSTKKLYSDYLSGILRLGFRQSLKFKEASGDLCKPERA